MTILIREIEMCLLAAADHEDGHDGADADIIIIVVVVVVIIINY